MAWSRVPDGSPFSGRAAVERARIELQHHRLAAAEELMPKALGDDGSHALEAVKTLVSLYKIQGRTDEALRLVRGASGRYPDKIGLLKELAALGSSNPLKLNLVRSGLEIASRSSPDDDRVWLGWANLATRTGEFAEAAQWLDRCEKRRPDDLAVIRGRLGLALASQDPEGAWRALARLPSPSVEPAEVLTLRAWFAGLSGDEPAERKALVELLAIEPANLKSLERLAELELRAGRPEESSKLRARKAELDRAKAQYEIVLFLPDAPLRSAQMAKFADALDRRLEARILWTMAVRQRPGDPEPTQRLVRRLKASTRLSSGRCDAAALLGRRRAGRSQGTSPGLIKAPARPGGAPPVFVDDAEAAGLRFTFDNGLDPNRHLPETMSGGVGVLDFDGDGWLDVYCVQGGAFLPDPGKPTGGDRLFRNRGDGTFEDATERSGIAAMPRGYGHGVAVGDFDNDGRPDLFVTRWDAYALYRNTGDGTFEDGHAKAGARLASRLADLGRIRRPRWRRRPRPLRRPLPRVGRGQPPDLPRPEGDQTRLLRAAEVPVEARPPLPE